MISIVGRIRQNAIHHYKNFLELSQEDDVGACGKVPLIRFLVIIFHLLHCRGINLFPDPQKT